MIVFQMPEYSPAGNIVLHEKPESKLANLSRRVSRRATINGGAYLDDQGYTDADRTLEVIVDNEPAAVEQIRALMAIYARYRCATKEGVFVGTISNITENAEELTIIFLVTNREI